MKRVAALIVAALIVAVAAVSGLSAGVAISHAGTAGVAKIYHQESSIRAVHTAHGYTIVSQSK